MSNPLKSYLNWEERWWLKRNLKWWERKRAKGKKNFIWRFTIFYGTVMSIGTSLTDYYFSGNFSLGKLIFGVPLYFIGGYVIGHVIWKLNEDRYQKFVRSNVEAKS